MYDKFTIKTSEEDEDFPVDQILLSFQDDDDRDAFLDWFEVEGRRAYDLYNR